MRVCLLLLALTLAGCASVPQMEQRLAAMEFHPNMYVVQAGDTFDSIAWRYKLDPAELARLNPGLGATLKPGTRINVRPGTTLSDSLRNRQHLQALAEARTQTRAQTQAPQTQTPRMPERTASPAVPPNEVTVARIEPREAVRQEPNITEIQASARSDAELLGNTQPRNNGWERVAPANVPHADSRSSNNPWPREEIIEDDLPPQQLAVNESGTAFARQPGQAMRQQGGNGAWVWPTQGQVARGFEPSRIGGQGVDIAGVPGQDVRAARGGKVVYSGRDLSGGGNLVIVQHDKNLMTTYSHADKLFVSEDDQVQAGDPIASLGWNSKRESVLRFEVRRDGKPLNPLDFLPDS